MNKIKKDLILTAWTQLSSQSSNKFWGVITLLSTLESESPVVANVTYKIKAKKLSNLLIRLFDFEDSHKKRNYGEECYYITFSNDWIAKVKSIFLKQKISIAQAALYFHLDQSFEEEIDLKLLVNKFIHDIKLDTEAISTFFDLDFTNEQNLLETGYTKADLFNAISSDTPNKINHKTLTFDDPYSVVSSAGELTRGPFIQPLYTTISGPECLVLTNFDFSKSYNLKASKASSRPNCSCRNRIFYGSPGTGKSHAIKKQTSTEHVIRTTFHPDSDYSTFVGCYKPTTKEEPRYTYLGDKAVPIIDIKGDILTENQIVYEFVDQAFLQAYIQAWKFYASAAEEINKQYLVIEEINRGNCAQIFGDLFQLLDRNHWGFSDYPIQADNDMQKRLAKAFNGLTISQEEKETINAHYDGKDIVSEVLSGKTLLLPSNLYIWATMNTSDQSLFPIDSAFKRRWDWQYMPISKGRDNGIELNWTIEAGTKKYDWWSFLNKINDHIASTTNSEDKKLGFFFCKANNNCIDADTFIGKVIFYLWNDVFKDFGFDNSIFQDEGETLTFEKFYTTDESGNVVVRKDKLERFLNNLEVEFVNDPDTEEIASEQE